MNKFLLGKKPACRLVGSLLFWAGLQGGATAQAQVYFVDLSQQQLTLPERSFFIEQVLDGRPSRAGIGTVLRGMGNTAQRAELKPTVATGLQALLTQQLPARPTDRRLLAVVRALHVQETISFTSEQATDDVALDFYLLDEAGNAHFALSTSETVQSKGMETTSRHPRQLAQALQACLAKLAAVDWPSVATQPGQPVASLLSASPVLSAAYPVFTDSVRRAGFYRTFLDFRNNSPVTTPALLVDAAPNQSKGWTGGYLYTPYLQTPDGGRGEQLRGAWGFSDGRQVFILHRNQYRLLVRRGEGFGFVGASAADPGAVSTGALLGGAIGGAIAAASTSGHPTDFTLNMVTGRVSALAEDGPAATAETVLHIYCRKSSTGTTPQPVFLNDKPVGQLAENQVLTLPYADHLHEIHLRLGTEPGRDLVFQPDFQAPVYVKVVRNADPTQPPLEIVPAKVGLFDLRRINPDVIPR